MKLINKIITVMIIFIILNSNVIALKDKSKYYRKHHRYMSINQLSTKTCKGDDKDINVWIFLYYFTRTAFRNAMDDMTKTLFKPIEKTVQKMTGINCTKMIGDEFHKRLEEEKKRLQTDVKDKMENGLGSLTEGIKELNLNKEQRDLLESKKDNPKELCTESTKILEKTQSSLKENTAIVDQMLLSIEYTQQRNLKRHFEDFKSFLDYLDCLICVGTERTGKHRLLEFIKIHIPKSERNQLKKDGFKQKMLEIKGLILGQKDNQAQQFGLSQNVEKISCKNLPESFTEEDNCQKISVGIQILTLFKILKDHPVDLLKCYVLNKLLSLPSNLIEFVLKIVKKVLSILASLILKGVIFVYYIYKIIHNFRHASKATDVNAKSKFWGKAGGYIVRVILLLFPGASKRMKLKLR